MAIACPDCGTIQDLPRLQVGTSAICATCDLRLERTSGRSVLAAFSCASATLILLVPSNLLPLMRVTLLGVSHESYLSSGVGALWSHQWVIVAGVVAACAVVLPFVRFGLLSVVLGAVLLERPARWLGPAFRWALQLDAWAMPDVFLIGCAVGYSRVAANLPVTVEAGGLCFLAAALLAMLSRAALDRRTVWRAVGGERPAPAAGAAISCTVCDLVLPAHLEGDRCPRCRTLLSARKLDAITRVAALILAGGVLYFPANLFPMSTDIQLGAPTPHRIVDGVRELVQAGLWPLAVLIFCTSIAIPVLKLVGLGWLAMSVQRRSAAHLVFKTKVYRLIDEIGRWSCVDVFTIAVFVPLMHFEPLVATAAAPGATAFVLVVVLTMAASRAFDPRLVWDAARRGRA